MTRRGNIILFALPFVTGASLALAFRSWTWVAFMPVAFPAIFAATFLGAMFAALTDRRFPVKRGFWR